MMNVVIGLAAVGAIYVAWRVLKKQRNKRKRVLFEWRPPPGTYREVNKPDAWRFEYKEMYMMMRDLGWKKPIVPFHLIKHWEVEPAGVGVHPSISFWSPNTSLVWGFTVQGHIYRSVQVWLAEDRVDTPTRFHEWLHALGVTYHNSKYFAVVDAMADKYYPGMQRGGGRQF